MKNLNMFDWIEGLKSAEKKRAMPVLSFPCVQLLGVTVKELIYNSDLQAKGMKLVADRTDACGSVSMMDLSVEAEAFGSKIKVSDNEVPTVVGHMIADADAESEVKIPKVGDGRTSLYIEAIGKACELITDRPVFAGVIGPFSLAGRLLDVSEAMIYCYEEPEMLESLLEKVTKFLIEYIKAYKAIGANGVVVAEPLAGLLPPKLNAEFSVKYMKKIVEAVQDEKFIVIYHNCGNGIPFLINDILTIGAKAYHFGNSIVMKDILEKIPSDVVVMGNIDPAGQFRGGTPESIREATLNLLGECSKHKNYIISSGCDIPPLSPWENIDSFFKAVSDFYSK